MATNFAARLLDMEDAERAYRELPADARLAMHAVLPFYGLLSTAERAVLERRFRGELAHDPEDPGLPQNVRQATRVAWDFRSRELVLAMISYADEVIAARLDLGGRLDADADACALALTATGSIVEIRRPGADGARPFVYRPSARPGERVLRGRAALSEAVHLGDRIRLGDLVTSEVLVLATAKDLPEYNAPPRYALYGDAEGDAGADDEDGVSRLDALRFRVMAEALQRVEPDDLPAAEARLVAQAVVMQATASQRRPALPMRRVSAFKTGWGLTYEVEPGPSLSGERFILVGTRVDDPERRIVLPGVDVGEQRVVVGAPLVLRGADGPLAIIPEIAQVTALPD